MQPFNFLAGLQQAPAPARAPIEVSYRKPGKFVNTLGRILDAVATAGGATPGYKTNVTTAQKQAEIDAVRAATQRLAADPDDNEAFTFLASRDPKGALDLRNSFRPQPKYEKVGNELVELPTQPGGSGRSIFKADSSVSPSADIQMLDRLTQIFGGDERKAAEYLANLKLPPEFKTVNRGDGGVEAFMFNRAPGTPGAAPRGVRNNNAGNLKDGPFARSQPGYKGADADGFAVFEDANAGTRAQVSLLQQRYFGRGLNTPAAIVNTYAPPGPENSGASVANYTNFIARRLGIGPNDPIPPGRVVELAAAMQEFENGTGAASGGPGVTRVAQTPDKTQAPPKGAAAPKGSASPAQQLAVLDEGIADLDRAISILKAGNNVTGPVIGLAPDAALNFTNPDTVTAGEAVARVSQKELRQILGGQFAAKEGEQLIKRAFNPGQSEEENLKRVESLRRQLVARRNELAGGGASPVTVTAPNGKNYSFPNEQAAAAFRQRAGIR
jgi:hypothetical protein